MNDLPHHLVEAFMSTLEEVRESDLILNVLDISNPNFQNMYNAVIDVLTKLEANEKNIITVLNKIDKLDSEVWLDNYKTKFPEAVCVSAINKKNLDELLNMIGGFLSSVVREIDVNIPLNRMDLVNMIHKEGQVFSVKYYEDRINIRASVPNHIAGKLENIS